MTTFDYDEDFVSELGPLGLTMKLRRIVDQCTNDARVLYRELRLEIEPNWHAVLLLIEKHETVGVAEIARRLGIKHPSASSLVKQLEERNLLKRTDDPNDGRRQVLTLSKKGKANSQNTRKCGKLFLNPSNPPSKKVAKTSSQQFRVTKIL